jgi:hypothetical protein
VIININGRKLNSPNLDLFGEFNSKLPPSQFEEFDPVFESLGIDANPDTKLLYWTNGLSIDVNTSRVIEDQPKD